MLISVCNSVGGRERGRVNLRIGSWEERERVREGEADGVACILSLAGDQT